MPTRMNECATCLRVCGPASEQRARPAAGAHRQEGGRDRDDDLVELLHAPEDANNGEHPDHADRVHVPPHSLALAGLRARRRADTRHHERGGHDHDIEPVPARNDEPPPPAAIPGPASAPYGGLERENGCAQRFTPQVPRRCAASAGRPRGSAAGPGPAEGRGHQWAKRLKASSTV